MEQKDDEISLDDLEPGDRKEEHSAADWCLAAGCGGCVDPVGCLTAMSQGCSAFIEGCLAQIGCGVLVLGLLGWGVVGLISLFTGG